MTKKMLLQATGPLSTLGAIFLIEFFRIPNPPPVYLTAVIFSTFVGGFVAGSLSSVLALAYTLYFFALPNQPFHYTSLDQQRVIAVFVVVPAIVLMVGLLKFRYEHKHEKLKKSEERYSLIMENSFDLIAIHTLDGTYSYVSPVSKSLLGYDSNQMIGTHCSNYIHPDDYAELRLRCESHMRSEDIYPAYVYRVRKSNETYTWFETTFRVILDPETSQPIELLSVSRDIAERKHAEELFLRSEKLAIAGELAAGIAHEIRNPLTSLKGFLQLIESGYEAKQEYFTIMNTELSRIDLILNELLMVAKPQSMTFLAKDIRQTIKDVISLLDVQAIMQNIHLASKFDSEPIVIDCNENQIKQLFINLIKNAMEAMPNGGQIQIEAKKSGDNAIIRVIDQGCGIPEEKIATLGQPFYTTKAKGTGLGLMVSYHIIKNHKGSISVTSKINEGTIFTVVIPMNLNK